MVGRKALVWFNPTNALYSKHNLDVNINPELGLMVNGTPFLIKLYFKAKPLLKNKIDIITHLMSISLSNSSPPSTVMSVLDIRQSKLIQSTVYVDSLTRSLNAELSYISAYLASM